MIFSCPSSVQVLILAHISNDGLIYSIEIKRVLLNQTSKKEKAIIPFSLSLFSRALRIFRLLQLPNLDNILQKFNQIADDISSWTFDGKIPYKSSIFHRYFSLLDFLYILDEHTSHSLPDTNQISSFDNQWLSKTLF